jgi:DNA-directed RNA polymerase specialized sigma24 family protein
MRHVLVDQARSASGQTQNRCEPLDVDTHGPSAGDEDLGALAVRKAVQRLAARDPRLGRVVRLRFFLGLTLEEIAAVRGVSTKTVKRDWQEARTWLVRELSAPIKPRVAVGWLRPAA